MSNKILVTFATCTDSSAGVAEAIQYQDHRVLRARMATEGWGAQVLQARHENGHWDQDFYQPKWISGHYCSPLILFDPILPAMDAHNRNKYPVASRP